MLKIYTFMAAAMLFLSSCGFRIGYIGDSFSPTSKVDVYVDPSSIKRPYTVMGKGYVERTVGIEGSAERIQAKALKKAREKGADAILFEDYFFLPTASLATTRIDSGRTSVPHSGIALASGKNILFLKYQ
jgi:hypothetical protein